MYETVDMTIIEEGDHIYYFNENQNGFFADEGIALGTGQYGYSVEVGRDGWQQYVSKHFIYKIVRDGNVIFEK